MSLFEQLFNLVAPHECVGCGAEGDLLCGGCVDNLPAVPSRCYRCLRLTEDYRTCAACRKHSALAQVWPVTSYEQVAKVLVRRLKFERARAAAVTIAKALARHGDDETVITFVPTANSRVRERGYDQAALIARSFAARQRLKCLPLLARVGERRQLGKDRTTRKQQAADLFRPINVTSVVGKRVIIIDDVLTTGATCEAAARVLKEAGAKYVSAVVFAVVEAHSTTEVKVI